MKIWERKNAVAAGFLLVACLTLLIAIWKSGEYGIIQNDSGLPEIEIVMADGVTANGIWEGGKDIKYQDNVLSLVADDEVREFNGVEVKGRGNATWVMTKKPYQFKLKQRTNLLDLGKNRKWILLANYNDATNLRTDVAFYVERLIGEDFAYRGEFVELYMNGEYLGLYYLTRGITVGKNAVDLKDPLGVLVELDNVYARAEDKYYVSSNGEHLTVKDMIDETKRDEAMADFLIAFNKLEVAVKEKNYDEIVRLVDIESFAKYYLIEEFLANPDGYFTSQYFYKDGVGDKIHAGPAWDFDIAINNVRARDYFAPDWEMTATEKAEEYWDVTEQYQQWSRLFARLIELPEFREEVNLVFRENMSGHKKELLSWIFRRAAKIYSASMKENEKWGKGSFVRGVKDLLDWVDKRYDYFEKEYGWTLNEEIL